MNNPTTELTQRERFLRTLRYEPTDHSPVYLASPWGETLARWRGEGLPSDVSWDNYRRYIDLLIETATSAM